MTEATRPVDKSFVVEHDSEPPRFSDGKTDDTFASDGQPTDPTPPIHSLSSTTRPSNPISQPTKSGLDESDPGRLSSVSRRVTQWLRHPLDVFLEAIVTLVEMVLDHSMFMAVFQKVLMLALAHCFFSSLGPTFFFLLIVIVPTLLIVICIHPGVPAEQHR